MWDVFTTIGSNTGVGFENALLLIVALGGFIFYADDFKKGIVLHFIFFGLLFMYLFWLDLNYAPTLVAFFITLVLMSFTLYASSKSQTVGGIT